MSRRKPYAISFIAWTLLAFGSFFVSEYLLDVHLAIDAAIALNTATFILFGLDKFFAIQHLRRVPEKILFLVTFLGGSIGTLLGMHLFQHKTRKTGFQFVVALLILLQVALFAFLLERGVL